MVLSVLAVLLVFGTIIIVHELGHMLAARACGVAVPDFGLGLGPSLISRKFGETRYHLCAIPFGGFVRIAGLEGDDALDGRQEWPPERNWKSKNGWQKAFMLVAGAGMNMVLALVAIFAMGQLGFPQTAVVIDQVEPGRPAAEAGVQRGDIVVSLNQVKITSAPQFSTILASRAGQPTALTVTRGEQPVTLTVKSQVMTGYNAGKPSIGVALAEIPLLTTTRISLVQPKSVGMRLGIKTGDEVTALNGEPVSNGWSVLYALASFDADLAPVDAEGNPLAAGQGQPLELTLNRQGQTLNVTVPGDTTMVSLGVQFRPVLQRLPLGQALSRSLGDAYYMVVGILGSLRFLFTEVGVKSVTGPVGIASMISQSARSDLYTFLQIVMVINLTIGVMNLLPLPALDGGRLVFVGLAGIGVRISEKREAAIHAVGLMVLLGLIALVSVSDLLSIF